MLYGRREERARIDRLLGGARAGRAGVLVVRGEAGIGKHALLRYAAERAGDFQVLRAAGAEAKTQLAFAGLHQLLRPALERLNVLPEPQARALRGAFGLIDVPANRFLIELGALSLLTALAAEQPLLCLVSHARWLDSASVDALVFVGRRLEAERIVLLFAARDDDLRPFAAPGLAELRLAGLDPASAGELLQAHTDKLAPQVRDRLIAETEGNPLALLELPKALTGDQLSGGAPLPRPLPLSGRLQEMFLERARRLPRATQTLLLIAAAEDTGELAIAVAAGQALGCAPEMLEPAEHAGLLEVIGHELTFRHSLVRSAVYQAATLASRQAAHQALVGVLQGEDQADRRAWHMAAASLEPDEQVAAALENSADRARRRGGPAAAAAALERAATLSPQPGLRAQRLVAAADCLWEAGNGERARTLLSQAEALPRDAAVQASMAQVRGAVELAAGTPATACTLLLRGARLILRSDPARATEMLVVAARAALSAGETDRIVEQIHPLLSLLPTGDVRVERVAHSLVAAGLARLPPGATMEPPTTVATGWPHPAFTWMWPMLIVATPEGDDLTADQRYARTVAARRAARTVSGLTVALANLTLAEAALGRWPEAIDCAAEGLRLATETGQHASAAHFLVILAALAAEQGRADDCRQLATQALAVATRLRLAAVSAFASWTLASLDLVEGRPEAALERLRGLAARGHPTAHGPIALLATGTLVEAAARTDALAELEPLVARFERWAQWDGRTWTVAVAHRCRALISGDGTAERHYQAALTTDGIGELPLELARTELLYGEWLRRSRRRSEARSHLRTALETFERLEAHPWADRARAELRASGESPRGRDPDALLQLTPRELQVARLAARGLTNRLIAARLFLTAHTVGYHLHKVYAKLGITSRATLSQFDLDEDPDR
jgi:DNA-binding CsgD family transcriptional regulator